MNDTTSPIYDVRRLGISKMLILGLQHMFAMGIKRQEMKLPIHISGVVYADALMLNCSFNTAVTPDVLSGYGRLGVKADCVVYIRAVPVPNCCDFRRSSAPTLRLFVPLLQGGTNAVNGVCRRLAYQLGGYP